MCYSYGMYFGRRRYYRHSFISIIAGLIISIFNNWETSKFVLAIVLMLGVLYYLLAKVVQNEYYKRSINFVNKQFVLRHNTLHNDQVTIIYTPDEKIVVMDNFTDKRRAKRMFSLNKKDIDINKAWNRACKVFDSFMTLESLEQFYSYDTNINVITLEMPDSAYKKKPEVTITKSNQGPKFVEMEKIQPDNFSNDANRVANDGSQFVDMKNIQEQKQYVPNETETPKFKEMGEILDFGANKIDVNFATASEIAILPGINIVGAKKIVEYRDLNGLFKSEDDFFAVANVKDHFVKKIKSMIIIGKPSDKPISDDGYSDGRVVDF